MKHLFGIAIIGLLLVSCKKEENILDQTQASETNPFSTAELDLFNYGVSTNVSFLDQFDSLIRFEYKESATLFVDWEWERTTLINSSIEEWEMDCSFRYVDINGVTKSLSIYMPYTDDAGEIRQRLFEMPIAEDAFDTINYENMFEFFPLMTIGGVDYENVYKVRALYSTSPSLDGLGNYNYIYYQKQNGIVRFDRKDGSEFIRVP